MGDGFDRDEVRDELKQSNTAEGGRQVGGGPGPTDMGAGGGSSGGGGYGNDQNAQNQQGQGQDERASASESGLSRGERFDEEQGGGRGPESVSADEVAQVGGSDGSFDQHTDANPLTVEADRLLGDQQARPGTDDFESDAQS